MTLRTLTGTNQRGWRGRPYGGGVGSLLLRLSSVRLERLHGILIQPSLSGVWWCAFRYGNRSHGS